jgi:hypothetical protein
MLANYEPEIGYITYLVIDGETQAKIEGYSYESIGEEWHKLDHALKDFWDEQEYKAQCEIDRQKEEREE